MLNEPYLKKIVSVVLFFLLIVLSFFIIQPVLLSIFIALVLAFIFSPLYEFLYMKLKSANLAATIIIILLILIIFIPLWYFLPVLIKQTFLARDSINQIDFANVLSSMLPNSESIQQLAKTIGPNIATFVNNIINSLQNSAINFLLDFPLVTLQLVVVLFSLFFFLKDKDQIVDYIKSVLPFVKDVQEKLIKYTKDVTYSVLYGQVVVGILQGIITGIGFFIFGVSNALLLTIFAIILGILPVVGPPLIWVPVAIFMFIGGNVLQGWGVVFFGAISSIFDNILRPLIMSRRTKIHSLVSLIAMIGGLLLFGIIGIIIGPLIISYLLVLLEVYRGKSEISLLKTEPAVEKNT